MAVRELRSFFLSFFLSFFRFNVVGVIHARVKISKERERERDVSSTVFLSLSLSLSEAFGKRGFVRRVFGGVVDFSSASSDAFLSLFFFAFKRRRRRCLLKAAPRVLRQNAAMMRSTRCRSW